MVGSVVVKMSGLVVVFFLTPSVRELRSKLTFIPGTRLNSTLKPQHLTLDTSTKPDWECQVVTRHISRKVYSR